MRAPSSHQTSSARLGVVVCAAALSFLVGPLAACGLSLSGLEPPDALATDASLADSVAPPHPDATSEDASIEAGGQHDSAGDGIPGDSTLPGDAADAGPGCVADDAAPSGPLDLSTFVQVGDAVYDENSDGKMTLTNSSNDQAGAAWYPAALPALSGYDLSWSFRIGPGDTNGEGIAFAVLSSDGAPGVGEDGEGLGLQGVTESGGDGGIPSGYAVLLVTYDNTTDPTNLGPTTLKLATMPAFTPVAEVAVPAALNDGNVYTVDVSWRAPSHLSATLHGPDGGVVNVTSSDPGLTAPSAYFGFTAATGGVSDSHNEIAGITMIDTCE